MAGGLFGWKARMADPYEMKYNRSADAAQNASYKYALESLGKAQGEELGGTPGFLAASSMGSSPGYLARLRAQTLRRGTSDLATQFSGIGAETARAKRDFKGDLLKMQKQRDLEKVKGGGLGGTLKRLAGGAIGFATGGPAGAAAGLGLNIPGLGGGGRVSADRFGGGGGWYNDVDQYGNPIRR